MRISSTITVVYAYETGTRTRIISENQEMKMEWKSLIFGSKKFKSLHDKLWPPCGGPSLWHDIKTGRQCITTVKTLGWKKPTPNVRLYKHLDVEDGAGFRWRASPSESDIHLETSCTGHAPGVEGWSHVVGKYKRSSMEDPENLSAVSLDMSWS